LGHGPLIEGKPVFQGILDGADIMWLTPDYPQARAIWREEIKPRFAGAPGVTLNETERRVTVANAGALELRSAESIENIRGRKLKGLIVDEAAYLDLEYAWPNVLRPTLVDLGGWAMLNSTPQMGSYFNELCERERANDLGAAWSQFHWRTRDNSALNADEIEAIYAELANQPTVLAQELDAALLQGASGKAFPEWRRDLHVQRVEAPRDGSWTWFGGIDWGYRAPGAVLLVAESPDGRQVVRWEYTFREKTPFDVGRALGTSLLRFQVPIWLAYDSAMDAVTDGGPTVTMELRRGLGEAMRGLAPPLIPAPKGKGSRQARKALLHEGLKWSESRAEDGTMKVQAWNMPRMSFHPDCVHTIRTLPILPVSERDPEDVDTTAEDHQFDALTYALMVRRPLRPETLENVQQDRHPGWDKEGNRRDPARRWKEMEFGEEHFTGMGYDLPSGD
jgi:hypothetical protein